MKWAQQQLLQPTGRSTALIFEELWLTNLCSRKRVCVDKFMVCDDAVLTCDHTNHNLPEMLSFLSTATSCCVSHLFLLNDCHWNNLQNSVAAVRYTVDGTIPPLRASTPLTSSLILVTHERCLQGGSIQPQHLFGTVTGYAI